MGGGARGLAHIGVLQALDHAGLTPGAIAGTSMGALVGALYAAGIRPQEIADLTINFPYGSLIDRKLLARRPQTMQRFFERHMLRTTTDRFLRTLGVEREDRTEALLGRIVNSLKIEDLHIPFACNAVDVVEGRSIVFTRGSLRRALRATIAFPLVFDPIRNGSQWLVDGGILNNVPTDLARQLGAGKLVLPDIHRPVQRISVSSIRTPFHLMSRLSNIVLTRAAESRLEQADFVYRIEVDFATFDFSQARRIIDKGRRVTEKNLTAIRELVTG